MAGVFRPTPGFSGMYFSDLLGAASSVGACYTKQTVHIHRILHNTYSIFIIVYSIEWLLLSQYIPSYSLIVHCQIYNSICYIIYIHNIYILNLIIIV